MQHLCLLVNFLLFVLRSGAGMVDHQPPTLRRLVENVRCQDIGVRRSFVGHDVDAFQHAVHRTGQSINPSDRLGLHMNRPFVAKDGFKRRTDGTRSHHARPAGMHAHDVIFIRLAGYELLDVR